MSDLLIRQAAQADLPALLAIYNRIELIILAQHSSQNSTCARSLRLLDEIQGEAACATSGRSTHRPLDSSVIFAVNSTLLRLQDRESMLRFEREIAARASPEVDAQNARFRQKCNTPNSIIFGRFWTILDDSGHFRTLSDDFGPTVFRAPRAMAFHVAGIERKVGRKFGKFWDVALYERET